ncbi:MAG: hypothetical protein ACOWWR_20160 [Eubacteriales bacterium]
MSVKAREVLKRQTVTYKQLVIIFAILLAFQLLMSYIQGKVDVSVAFVINIITTIFSLAILFFLVTKVLPRYEYMVLENDFVIYRATILRPKLVFIVPLTHINSIKKDFEMMKFHGRKKKYTLYGIKDKVTYIIKTSKDNKQQYIFIQCSKKFIDKLEKTMHKRIQE